MNKVTINKKAVCFASERGHYGFEYPSTDFVTTNGDIEGDRLNWIEFRGLIPVKVTKETAESNELPTNIVWVESYDIQK